MPDKLAKKVFFNINWILLEKISKAVLTGLTSIIIARYLGAEGLGAISIALTLYSIVAVMGTLGLERVILKELGDDNCDVGKLIGGVVLSRAIGAVAAFIVVNALVVWFYDDNAQLQIMILMLSFAYFIAIGSIFEVFYRHQLRSSYVTVVRVLGLFSSAISKIIIVILSLDVIWFTLPLLIETMVISIGFIYLRINDKQLQLGKVQYQLQEAKRLLHFCWPLALSGLAGNLYFQIDKVLIHQFLDNAALGRYALLFQLTTIILLLFNAINLSVTPVLNKLYYQDQQQYWQEFRTITALKFCLSLFMAAGLFLFGNLVIPFVAGSDYIYSQGTMLAFASYIILVSITSLNIESLILANIVKPIFYIRIMTMILNIGLNLLLIPLWGISGAAFATVASVFFHTFLFPIPIKGMRLVIWNVLVSLTYVLRTNFYRTQMVRLVNLAKR